MPHGPFFLFWILIPIVCLALVLKLLADRKKPEMSDEVQDETRMIQEMYRNLSRMEERIDALETLLLEQGEKDGK